MIIKFKGERTDWVSWPALRFNAAA